MIANSKAAALAVAVALLAGCAEQTPPAYYYQPPYQPPPQVYNPVPRPVPQLHAVGGAVPAKPSPKTETETARRETAPEWSRVVVVLVVGFVAALCRLRRLVADLSFPLGAKEKP